MLARSQSALLKYAWHTLGLSFDGYSDVLDLEPEVVLVKQEVIDLDLDQEEEEVGKTLFHGQKLDGLVHLACLCEFFMILDVLGQNEISYVIFG